MNKCVFLDRDGVINKDYVDYAWSLPKFELLPGVIEGLKNLKEAGYKLIIITNQSGIVKGIYDHSDVYVCHSHIQEMCDHIIDDMYYSPWHQDWTNSLSRKPASLLFERAIAKYNIDVTQSWMVGDKQRDLIPARKVALKTILVGNANEPEEGDYQVQSLLEASKHILNP